MTLRLTAAILLALALTACGSDNADPPPTPPDDNTPPLIEEPTAQNRDVDSSQAPGADDPAGPGPLAGPAVLRANQIRTRYLIDGAVTAGKIGYSAVAVTVMAAATTGSSAATPNLVGGILVTCHPNGNQDQHVDNIVLNGDGSITVTLAVAATANNVFRCVVWKANAFGIN